MPLDRLLTLKPLAALGGALSVSSLARTKTPQGTLLALGLTAACYFLPDLLIYNTRHQTAEDNRT